MSDSSIRENLRLVRAEVFLLLLSAAGLLVEFRRKRRAAGSPIPEIPPTQLVVVKQQRIRRGQHHARCAVPQRLFEIAHCMLRVHRTERRGCRRPHVRFFVPQSLNPPFPPPRCPGANLERVPPWPVGRSSPPVSPHEGFAKPSRPARPCAPRNHCLLVWLGSVGGVLDGASITAYGA
jgi:hypothetical protein